MNDTHGRGGIVHSLTSSPLAPTTQVPAYCSRCLHYMLLDLVTLEMFCPSCGES